MHWHTIDSEAALQEIQEKSAQQKVLIFKHSTRCAISATALDRLQRKWSDEKAGGIVPYFLDLISYRELSNEIARRYQIQHESPQVLLIEQGRCVYNASHMGISFDEIAQQAVKVA
jgi:bacillithiol system protein YtxJ